MGIVTVLWSLAAGVSVTLAVAGGSIRIVERRGSASATIFLLGIAVAVAAYIELLMMHSATPAEYGRFLRWYHVPVFFAMLGQALFVHYYLGTGRMWLLGVIIAARLVILAVDFMAQPAFNFSNIVSLQHFSLLGEQVSAVGAAVPRAGWQEFAVVTLVFLIAYYVDAMVQCWRSGEKDAKRKVLAVGLGISVPWLCTFVYGQAIIYGFFHAPMSNAPWYVGALCIAAYELGRDYVISRGAVLELAELQHQSMRVQMANVLGQLSSALTHELSQPLAANALNAEAALKCLDTEKPDLEVLRAVLTDVRSDTRRCADMINQMRRLFAARSVEMRPLRIEDVVQDSLALISVEARAKKVALSVLMQPGLPRVIGNRVQLSQVLINLLTNSIYAVQGRPVTARRVVVEARADNGIGEVEVAVTDTGSGVPDDVADKLFAPFFTTKAEGMGMGLALSLMIVEAHGGRLWTDRSIGQEGAIFRFTLQRA
ncbi:MAG TPA: ATP-binding protein [Rhizomicrobium sp.]|nr:ATP-binding protein [Rhizomicrobium sp.]